jgi:hypothetical protein
MLLDQVTPCGLSNLFSPHLMANGSSGQVLTSHSLERLSASHGLGDQGQSRPGKPGHFEGIQYFFGPKLWVLLYLVVPIPKHLPGQLSSHPFLGFWIFDSGGLEVVWPERA